MTETKPEHKSERIQDKTLQLLVPNSKRLGGYTRDTQEHKKKDRKVLNKSRKFVKITRRVVYMAKTKARQALDRSRKVVNTKIYI